MLFVIVSMLVIFVGIPVGLDLAWRAQTRDRRAFLERSYACCDAVISSPATGLFTTRCPRRAMFDLTGFTATACRKRCHEHVSQS